MVVASAIDKSMYCPFPVFQQWYRAAFTRNTSNIPTIGSVQIPPMSGNPLGYPWTELQPVKHWIKVP